MEDSRSCLAVRFLREAISCETFFMLKTVLVTGSSGLIGSEAVEHFDRQGNTVVGIDNNMRRKFFGAAGGTL
jgi:FlaA1/EpsC-like NDP-sugar epimerase